MLRYAIWNLGRMPQGKLFPLYLKRNFMAESTKEDMNKALINKIKQVILH